MTVGRAFRILQVPAAAGAYKFCMSGYLHALLAKYVFVIFICNFSLKPIDSGEYKEYNYDRKNKSGQNVLGVITWHLQNRKMK